MYRWYTTKHYSNQKYAWVCEMMNFKGRIGQKCVFLKFLKLGKNEVSIDRYGETVKDGVLKFSEIKSYGIYFYKK